MKGNKLVIAVILALIVCLVLIPTCAFADGDQGLSDDNLAAVSSTTGGDNSSGDSEDGGNSGVGTGSDDANLSGNSGNDGSIGGSTEGSSEDGDDGNKGEDVKQPEPSGEEEGKTTSGEESSNEDNNVPDEENKVEEAAQLTANQNGSTAVTANTPLQAQIDAGETTIVLDDDYDESIVISEGQNVIIDLNGHKLTNKQGEHTIVNKGTLTIRDSVGTGVVDNVTHGRGALVNAGTAYIEGGTFTRSKENGQNNENNGGNSWYVIKNVGTMTISGNTRVEQNGHYSSLIANGWQNPNDHAGDSQYGDRTPSLTIESGSFSGGINTVKNDDYGYLTINGGTFTNVRDTVVMNWNVAEINGGSFTTDGKHVLANGFGDNNADKGEITINGGSFESVGNGNLFGYNGIAKVGKGTITINGGSFDGVANSDETPYDVIYNNGVFTDSNVKNLVNKDNVAVISANGKTAIASDENAASIKEIIDEAVKSGDALVIENLPENVTVGNVPEGVTIINNSGSTLTVNGVEVKPGESYTVPTTAAPAFAPLSAKYFVLEGKAQQWTDGDLEFVLNSNAVVKVLIDGVEVEFTVAEDGTVTIASAVIEALEAGTHEIQFIFADGSCTTTFTK